MAARAGWKGLDGTLYERFDKRLSGYGNPPNDPGFQATNPGAGQFPLAPARIDDGPSFSTDPHDLVEA